MRRMWQVPLGLQKWRDITWKVLFNINRTSTHLWKVWLCAYLCWCINITSEVILMWVKSCTGRSRWKSFWRGPCWWSVLVNKDGFLCWHTGAQTFPCLAMCRRRTKASSKSLWLTFQSRGKKRRAGREQKETMQPCLHSERLLGGHWGLLSRMDVIGARPAKLTLILMQARFGLPTHPLWLFGPDIISDIFSTSPSHKGREMLLHTMTNTFIFLLSWPHVVSKKHY